MIFFRIWIFYERWHGLSVFIIDYDWYSVHNKNSTEFECVVIVMHRSLQWMLGEEEGLFKALFDHSSGWWSGRCGHMVRGGGCGDLSFGESELLCKRNSK
jgi:hypothetical protein